MPPVAYEHRFSSAHLQAPTGLPTPATSSRPPPGLRTAAARIPWCTSWRGSSSQVGAQWCSVVARWHFRRAACRSVGKYRPVWCSCAACPSCPAHKLATALACSCSSSPYLIPCPPLPPAPQPPNLLTRTSFLALPCLLPRSCPVLLALQRGGLARQLHALQVRPVQVLPRWACCG